MRVSRLIRGQPVPQLGRGEGFLELAYWMLEDEPCPEVAPNMTGGGEAEGGSFVFAILNRAAHWTGRDNGWRAVQAHARSPQDGHPKFSSHPSFYPTCVSFLYERQDGG